MSYDDLHQALFLYSLTLPRLMACFIFLPILNKQTLGGTMVRNGVLCSLALFIFPMINQQDLPAETDGIWLMIILGKEVLLGLLIGFVAAIPFWAIEAAGFLVDNQRGAAMASMFNPTLGSQSTPTAVLLTQTLITLFFSGGGFVAFIYALFNSYASWYRHQLFPVRNGRVGTLFLCPVRTINVAWGIDVCAFSIGDVPRRIWSGIDQPFCTAAKRFLLGNANQKCHRQCVVDCVPGVDDESLSSTFL